MKILILSTSLNPASRGLVLAQHAVGACDGVPGVSTCLIDLQELELPFCGAAGAQDHRHARALVERVQESDGVIIVSPVYNYDVNSACKNAIELTGEAWENKVVGFICTAGGASSYMSVMGFANSLMLDFRCLIVPRFVYATGGCVRDGRIVEPEIARRVEQLCQAVMDLAGVWPPRD